MFDERICIQPFNGGEDIIYPVEQFFEPCSECVPVCISLIVDTLSFSFDFCLMYILKFAGYLGGCS